MNKSGLFSIFGGRTRWSFARGLLVVVGIVTTIAMVALTLESQQQKNRLEAEIAVIREKIEVTREWFRGREAIWQNLPARLVTDRQRASYGLAVLFAESNIAMIRHRLDLGQAYSGIEDYFQSLPARHTPEDIMRESDNPGDGDQSNTFGMLSHYVGYEMARVAEQEYSRHSANEGGLDRVALLMGWRDYIRGETVRVSADEAWGILGAMSRRDCQ